MYQIRRMQIWLRRMFHSRGFGIQSPYDYSFVRYVINEHYPYYGYKDLKEAVKGIDAQTRKLCRLYFRLTNYRQPYTVVDYMPLTEAYAQYMRTACHRVRICPDVSSIDTVEMARMSLSGDYRRFYEDVLAKVDAKSILIVEGINDSSVARQFWRQIQTDERTGVTFDLYYAGIVFFDKDRYKQNYMINF